MIPIKHILLDEIFSLNQTLQIRLGSFYIEVKYEMEILRIAR